MCFDYYPLKYKILRCVTAFSYSGMIEVDHVGKIDLDSRTNVIAEFPTINIFKQVKINAFLL